MKTTTRYGPRKSRQIVFPKERAATPKENYVGRKFGKYLVLEFVGRDRSHNAVWKCRCECGKESVVRGIDLSSHSQCRSCTRIIDLTDQRFGRLVVLERRGYIKHGHNVLWLCVCDCG